MPTTKPVDSKNPKNDLRVIWSGDNKTIVSDRRPSRLRQQPPTQPVRKWKVIGPKPKEKK